MQATIDGIRMHWREAGHGPRVVVFVHAFPLDGLMWEDQLRRLPRRWRLLAPDLRGFGMTRAGDSQEPLTMERFADDLALWLEHLGTDRVTLCGLSMGGYVAFAFWRRYRERVSALVLCDTRAGADSEEGREARRTLAARVRAEGAQVAAEALIPRLLAQGTRRGRPELEQRLRAMIESQPAESIARAAEGMALREDSTPLLREIDVPVLVVVGGEDAIATVEEASRMRDAIPDARLVEIAGAAHLPNLEQPAAFDTALVHFLEAIE